MTTYAREGNAPPLLVGVRTYTVALEISMVISQKIMKQSTSRPNKKVVTLGIYPKDAQSYHKDMCSTMFITTLFDLAKTWKQPKCPST